MRAEVFKCPGCGNVYFADPVAKNPCPDCGRVNVFPLVIKTGRYTLPVHSYTKLYACHADSNSDDFKTQVAAVQVKDGTYFITVNDSKDGPVELAAGTKVRIGKEKVEVIKGDEQ